MEIERSIVRKVTVAIFLVCLVQETRSDEGQIELTLGATSSGWIVPLGEIKEWRQIELVEAREGIDAFKKLRLELKGTIHIPSGQRVFVALSGQPARTANRPVDVSDYAFLQTLEPDTLISLSIGRAVLDRDSLVHLPRYRELKEVSLGPLSRFDDGVLSTFKKMPWIESLSLAEGKISDDGLRSLSGLHKLARLNLYKTKVSDAGLIHLKKLKQLEKLNLGFCDIKGNGLAHLSRCRKLRILILWGTAVRDDQLGLLRRFLELGTLDLTDTPLTDAGLKEIADLASLEALVVNHTRISDRGLHYLAQIDSLKHLDAIQTQVTAKGVESLRRIRPEITVRYGNDVSPTIVAPTAAAE